MKLIDLHKKWIKSVKINDRVDSAGSGGLCNAIPKKYQPDLNLFEPHIYQTYWGSELPKRDVGEMAMYSYNPLRQTIVLLICAMNNEL